MYKCTIRNIILQKSKRIEWKSLRNYSLCSLDKKNNKSEIPITRSIKYRTQGLAKLCKFKKSSNLIIYHYIAEN